MVTGLQWIHIYCEVIFISHRSEHLIDKTKNIYNESKLFTPSNACITVVLRSLDHLCLRSLYEFWLCLMFFIWYVSEIPVVIIDWNFALAELLKIARQNMENKVPTMVFCNHNATSYFVMKFLEENDIPSTILNAEIKSQVLLCILLNMMFCKQ
jgi:hypothetical protein